MCRGKIVAPHVWRGHQNNPRYVPGETSKPADTRTQSNSTQVLTTAQRVVSEEGSPLDTACPRAYGPQADMDWPARHSDLEGPARCMDIEEDMQMVYGLPEVWDVDEQERVSPAPIIDGSEFDLQEERMAHSLVEDIPEEVMEMDPVGGQFPSSSTSAPSTLRLPSPPSPSHTNSETDRSQLWRFILCLVTFLNLRFHLPQRACNLILNVLQLVFHGLGALQDCDKLPKDVRTAFKAVGLSDSFDVHVMCPTCHRVYPSGTASHTCCDGCGTALFHPKTTHEGDFDGTHARITSYTDKPKLKLPVRLVSHQLRELLESGDTEVACESWRSKDRDNGVLESVMDGRVCKTLLAVDGTLFLDNSPTRAEPDELRLVASQACDGLVPISFDTLRIHHA
jgi:hypothetical protein